MHADRRTDKQIKKLNSLYPFPCRYIFAAEELWGYTKLIINYLAYCPNPTGETRYMAERSSNHATFEWG